jgi:hypothetical protein
VVVGHALHNDFKALGISHPRDQQRDTARYPPYRKGMGNGSRPQKLAALSLQYLGWTIQTGEHSPLEDAVASLRLYELKRKAWEKAGGAAAMCYDKEADSIATAIDVGAAGGAGLAKCLGAAGAAGAAAHKPHKPPREGLAVCLGGAGLASKGIHKPKFVQGKHRWSLKEGEKKKDSKDAKRKKGAFAGLLSAHGM